jgi:hypothetical protein
MIDDTDYDSPRDKIRSFRELTLKQRLDWLYQAQEFLEKLPEQTRKNRQKLRDESH